MSSMRMRTWLPTAPLLCLCGAASAAQFSLSPVRLAPAGGLPVMTLRSSAAPSLYSPAASLGAVTLAAPGLAPTPVVAAPAIVAPPALPAEEPASPEELSFAAKAALELAVLAEDWGEENGMKASRMTGRDFLAMLDAGLDLYARKNEAQAPSPRAYAAARTVQAQVVRLVKTMLKADEPLDPQIRRILSVWSIFNQAMEEASRTGGLSAITAEALLFASQVEKSV